jgi:pimeloyl-ACP methyl ester carboxylesterase
MSLHTIAVPGATLHTEVRGSGPPLLLITGGNGDSDAYGPIARILSERYTVLTYDPRGNSRSPLTGPPEDLDIPTNSDDAAAVLASLADGPALVFGSSSGALIALDLVIWHPKMVRTAVLHEPPAIELLPDVAEQRAFVADVYETYRRAGLAAAMRVFAAGTGPADELDGERPEPVSPEAVAMLNRTMANMEFFMAHEIRPFTAYRPDLDALAAAPTRIVPAGGNESRQYMPYRPNTVIAERLGINIVDFPGGHTGYMEHPAEFAAQLAEVLG